MPTRPAGWFNPITVRLVWLVALLVIASFLRLWNLSENVMFQGDQGRDALIVARIFRDFDPVFIGPVTSVGNMYLGPLYYYFMAPFLWLSYPSPLGPAYAVALLGIATVWLVYRLGRELVGEAAAGWAATIYALSSAFVVTTRFSWNPNPEPFVTILMVYWIWLAWKKNAWYWVLVLTCFAVHIQLHYVTLLTAGGLGFIWLLQLREQVGHKKNQLVRQLTATAVGIIIVLTSLSPLVLFDSRHDWLNARAFANLISAPDNFTQNNSKSAPAKALKILRETHGRSMHILFEMLIGKHRTLNTILVVFVLLVLFSLLTRGKQVKGETHQPGLVILVSFLLVGILGTSVYEHTVFDHYIGFLYPVSALLLGVTIEWCWQRGWLGRIGVAAFALVFLQYNLPRYPLLPSGTRVSDLEYISQTILSRVAPGEKYNIVLLSETGDIDAMKYRYFLEASATPPVTTEQRGQVEKLFIINEDRKLANVVDSPVYEIVVFPNHHPSEVYETDHGPEITVLEKKRNNE